MRGANDTSGMGGTRRLAGALLYLFAALGVFSTISGVREVQDFHRRHADTGDFTGASMLASFLIVVVVPLTLIALIGGLWLYPPTRWFARPAERVPADPVERSLPAGSLRTSLAIALQIVGLGILVGVGVFLTHALSSAHRDQGLGGGYLVALATQDLIAFSPLIALAIVLFLVASKVTRPKP